MPAYYIAEHISTDAVDEIPTGRVSNVPRNNS